MVFDAVGTLIKPTRGVIETYHETGREFGSRLSVAQVRDRFAEGRRLFFRSGEDLVSSDAIEYELWRRLVGHVFCDVDDSGELFVELWRRFAEVQAWEKFEDIDDCLQRLKAVGVPAVIGSNFDSRLLEICAKVFDDADFEEVFCSSLVGFRKPDSRFYRHIEDRYQDYQIVMVGDDQQNDVEGPAAVGWTGLRIDRQDPATVDTLTQLLSGVVAGL